MIAKTALFDHRYSMGSQMDRVEGTYSRTCTDECMGQSKPCSVILNKSPLSPLLSLSAPLLPHVSCGNSPCVDWSILCAPAV
eukprot:COSAG03_NODE_3001_length_2296_cov_1.720983_3_plen_82_part_00